MIQYMDWKALPNDLSMWVKCDRNDNPMVLIGPTPTEKYFRMFMGKVEVNRPLAMKMLAKPSMDNVIKQWSEG